MFLIKKLKHEFGFTFIELVISVFIIVLIFSIFLTNYHSTNKRSELNVTVQKVVGDIRVVQSYSLGSQEFGGDAPEGGWGAHFSEGASNYIIFADVNGDHIYNPASEEYKTINFPVGISINSIDIDNYVDIVFLSPDPTIYINTDLARNVQIQLTDGDSNKTIEINFFGLVDVVD